jgi:hypothetical protein
MIFVPTVSTIILLANGIFDLSCACSIFADIPPLNTIHTSLWYDPIDSTNSAATHLMAFLIFFWGTLRIWGAFDIVCRTACSFSYLIEGMVFASETVIFQRMHFAQGLAVSIASLFLGIYVFLY